MGIERHKDFKLPKEYKPHKYWTKNKVFAEAKKYKSSKTWFLKSPSSYAVAHREGWYQEAKKKYLKPFSRFLTKEDVIKKAKKYKIKKDFRLFAKTEYDKACKNGWLEECCSHMLKRKFYKKDETIKWSKELIFQQIKKYNTWEEILKDTKLHGAIIRLKLIKLVKKEKNYKKKIKWTKKTLLQEALKYKTKKELRDNNPSAMRVLHQKGLADICFKHMDKNKEELNKNDILKAIKKSKSKLIMSIKYPREYQMMLRKKYNFDHLFQEKLCLVEKRILHPKIKHILNKFNIKFLYERSFKLKNKKIIPDFIIDFNSNIYIVEAKSSLSHHSHCRKNISRQCYNQILAVKKSYPKKIIKHIILSESGFVKSDFSDYQMSLKEFSIFLKTGKYKNIKQKPKFGDLMKIANKLIKEYFLKYPFTNHLDT